MTRSFRDLLRGVRGDIDPAELTDAALAEMGLERDDFRPEGDGWDAPEYWRRWPEPAPCQMRR